MTLSTRTRCYILPTMLLIFSLLVTSCGSPGGSDKADERKATQPPASEVTKSSSEEATPVSEAPTKPAPAGEETKPPADPSGVTGIFADPQETLDSYRMRTKMTLQEGEGMLGEDMTTEMEWVREPEASHITMYDSSEEVLMEIISIGDESWTNMDGETWFYFKSGTDQESPFSQEDLQANLEDILEDMESSMKKAGQDTVNDVRCTWYTVDTDFSMPFPSPEDAPEEALQLLPKEMEGHIEGKICVADERDLPQVIIRSQTTQELTLKYASGKEETMAYEEERDLYDINASITIKPPENVMEMPSMPTQPGGQPGEAVEVASLDDLDSYRLELKMSTGGAMTTGITIEYVREPPARRLLWGMGETPMAEYIWSGDTVWVKVAGTWVQGTEEDAAEHLDNTADVMTPEEDMVLAGEETVNGVSCKHYVYDLEMATQSMHKEVWVANQSDLPPVVIRGLFRMKTGQVTIESEANVTDINTPITIEPPQ